MEKDYVEVVVLESNFGQRREGKMRCCGVEMLFMYEWGFRFWWCKCCGNKKEHKLNKEEK